MIAAGDLRDRVDLLRKERVPDGMGGWDLHEAPLVSVWARVETPDSKTGVVAQKDVELRTHEITLRYTAEPKIKDVAVFRSLRLEVKGVRHDSRRKWTFLDCVPEVV